MKTLKNLGLPLMTLLIMAMVSSCSDDENLNENAGTESGLKLRLTDAPVDDGMVEATFVSFTAVKLDGKTYPLNGTQTVKVSALTEGKTEILFDEMVEAGSYSNLSLVLDYEMDETGNRPGCYVLTTDGKKHDLQLSASQSNEIVLSLEDGEMSEMTDNEFIVDFDLRKAIRYEQDASMEDRYNFHSELNSSLRLVENGNYAKLEGRINDNAGMGDDKLIVYAYAKGTFNASEETRVQSRTDVMFESAVSSCEADENGYFSLHFLEKGEYDLKIVSYKMSNEGQAEAVAFLETGLIGGINLLGLTINSDTFINLTIASRTEI